MVAEAFPVLLGGSTVAGTAGVATAVAEWVAVELLAPAPDAVVVAAEHGVAAALQAVDVAAVGHGDAAAEHDGVAVAKHEAAVVHVAVVARAGASVEEAAHRDGSRTGFWSTSGPCPRGTRRRAPRAPRSASAALAAHPREQHLARLVQNDPPRLAASGRENGSQQGSAGRESMDRNAAALGIVKGRNERELPDSCGPREARRRAGRVERAVGVAAPACAQARSRSRRARRGNDRKQRAEAAPGRRPA